MESILDAAQRIVDGGGSSEAGVSAALLEGEYRAYPNGEQDSEDSEQARRSKLSLEYILNP